MTISCHLGI